MRERALRWLLREGLTRPWLFGTALKLGRLISWALPPDLRAKVGVTRPAGPLPTAQRHRKVLLLNNCVQPAMAPSIDAATARVLDTIGVQSIIAPESGCCGAIRQHLDDHDGARNNIRRNIDAWWPLVETRQVEAIVINASGCGAMVKDYAHLLRGDRRYAERAHRISALARDVSEVVAAESERLAVLAAPDAKPPVVAFHSPCTLQHGLRLNGVVESILRDAGFTLTAVPDPHLCCGSAGTYSLLQPEISRRLRDDKVRALESGAPEVVATANIGCLAQLESGAAVPVVHWIELLDRRLA